MLKRLLSLGKDFAVYGLGAVLERLVGFLLIPLYTRFLKADDYGVLAMLAIVGAFFEVFAFLGMRSALFREYSLADERQRPAVVTSGVFTVVTLSVVLVIGAWLTSTTISRILLGSPRFESLVVWSAIGAALAASNGLPLQVLQAERRARAAAGLNLAKLLVTTISSIALVVFAKQGVWGVVASSCATNAIFAILMLFATVRRFGYRADLRVWTKMMRYGSHFVPFRILSVGIAIFADYAVQHMLGLREAGLFSVAGRFAVPLAVAVTATNQAWLAYKFKIFKEERDPETVFRSITTYYVAAILGLWILVALWGPQLLIFLTPVEFHPAAKLIPLLALARLILGVYQMFSTGIELNDNPRSLWIVSAAGLVVSVSSTFLLIPRLGAAGAALASILGYVAMIAVVYSVAKRLFHVRHDWWSLSTITVAAILAVLGSLGVDRLGWIPRFGVLLGLTIGFPVASLALLARSASERQRVRRSLDRLRQRLKARFVRVDDSVTSLPEK